MEQVSKSLARDWRALVDDAEALLQHTVRDTGAGYGDARAKLEERIASARSQLASLEAQATEGIKHAGRAADGYVRENPWPVIGVSAGVGLLLGLLIGRK